MMRQQTAFRSGKAIQAYGDVSNIERQDQRKIYQGKNLKIINYHPAPPPRPRPLKRQLGQDLVPIHLKKINTQQIATVLLLIGEESDQSFMLFDAQRLFVTSTNTFRTFDTANDADCANLYTVCAYTSQFLKEENAKERLIHLAEKCYQYYTPQRGDFLYAKDDAHLYFVFKPIIIEGGLGGCLLITGDADVRRSRTGE